MRRTRLLLLSLWLCAALTCLLNSASRAADGSQCEPGFVSLFDGKTLDGWVGLNDDKSSYYAQDGMLICKETGKVHLFSQKEYGNFVLRLQIKLDPGANNGVGVRTKITKVPHLEGMELQVLDDPFYVHGIPRPEKDPKDWTPLKDYQHHGSVYGVVPARTGHLRPTGEWNDEEVTCNGSQLTVKLNAAVIVDCDLHKVQPIDGHEHPGLFYEKGHIGLHAHGGYGAKVYFRNLRIKEL